MHPENFVQLLSWYKLYATKDKLINGRNFKTAEIALSPRVHAQMIWEADAKKIFTFFIFLRAL